MVKAIMAGAVNWDTTLFVDKYPPKGDEIIVRRITHLPGGKAGNTAVAAAKLLGPKQAAVFAGLGKDSIGAEHVKIFEGEGVVTSGLKFCDGAESGQAYVVIDDQGANTVFKYWGANELLTPNDLDDSVRRGLIGEVAIVAIMGPPFETASKLAAVAANLGKVVAWDPGVHSKLGLEKVRGLLKNVNYVLANEDEVANLTGDTNPDSAVKRLSAVNERLKIVVKLGARGSVMYSGGRKDSLPALDLAAFGLNVVNTLGCGDSFHGAFIAAISEGHSDFDALKWGNCAGGIKASRFESRGSPDRDTLFRYLS